MAAGAQCRRHSRGLVSKGAWDDASREVRASLIRPSEHDLLGMRRNGCEASWKKMDGYSPSHSVRVPSDFIGWSGSCQTVEE